MNLAFLLAVHLWQLGIQTLALNWIWKKCQSPFSLTYPSNICFWGLNYVGHFSDLFLIKVHAYLTLTTKFDFFPPTRMSELYFPTTWASKQGNLNLSSHLRGLNVACIYLSIPLLYSIWNCFAFITWFWQTNMGNNTYRVSQE